MEQITKPIIDSLNEPLIKELNRHCEKFKAMALKHGSSGYISEHNIFKEMVKDVEKSDVNKTVKERSKERIIQHTQSILIALISLNKAIRIMAEDGTIRYLFTEDPQKHIEYLTKEKEHLTNQLNYINQKINYFQQKQP
jgi:hypothetical protein